MKASLICSILLTTIGITNGSKLIPPELTDADIIVSDANTGNSRMASVASDYTPGVYNPRFFDQTLTHKDNRQTFKQRYYVNADFYKPGGPAFLYISGEAANSPNQVSRGLAAYLAKKHNGIVFSLEHRYYGVSTPFKNITADNLIYLSSDYGLKDLANFAQNIKNPIDNKKLYDTKWYAVGGSYAGNLAAWIRQDRPDLFNGAIASSGPVEAKADFFEYDLTVGKVLGEECLNNMNAITNYIDQLYEKKDSKFYTLKEKLGCKDLTDDIQFLYTFADTLAYIVQYARPTSNPSVATLCSAIKTANSIEDKVNAAFDTYLTFYKNMGSSCVAFAADEDLLNNSPGEYSIFKQWTYQCCTEFGYWQTAVPSWHKQKSTRSKFLTVDWFNKFYCSERHFGKKIGPPNTAHIQYRHAGKYIGTNRIIFTNGDSDPWATLSVTDPKLNKPNRPVLMIKNGSHVIDLGTPGTSTNPSVQEVQNIIIETIDRWVNRRY